MRTINHWIQGKPTAGSGDRRGPVWNPATGEQQAEVVLATRADVDEHWHQLLGRHLTEAVADGRLAADTPIEEVIDVLLSIAVGQQVHAIMGSELAEPARQLRMIEHCLHPWQR